MSCVFKDLADKLLGKLSTKDPEKVAKGQTVHDGWYMLGQKANVPTGNKEKPAEEEKK